MSPIIVTPARLRITPRYQPPTVRNAAVAYLAMVGIGIPRAVCEPDQPLGAAVQAADGYFRILGRIDDVINVAGHWLVTKAASITVEEIAEAAAVPVMDELRGRAIEMYVSFIRFASRRRKRSLSITSHSR